MNFIRTKDVVQTLVIDQHSLSSSFFYFHAAEKKSFIYYSLQINIAKVIK